MKVGVFDSGVGGLTVLKELVNKYPNNHYIYYGDTKNIPYGDKSLDELKLLVDNIMNFMITKNVDIVVIACGTVSSNLTEYIKSTYKIPIIDIISPTINYINNSSYEKIGVIATNSTINSKVFSKRINKDVKEVSCKSFVPLIESNNLSNLDYYLDLYLKDLKDRDIVILGCTHYPIIEKYIRKYLGNNIDVLNMASLVPNVFKNDSLKVVDLYFSLLDDKTKLNVKSIIDFKINSLNEIKKP